MRNVIRAVRRPALTRTGIERIKTCAIALLTVSAVFFARGSGMFDGMYYAIIGGTSASPPAEVSSVAKEAARPFAIVATNILGQRAAGLYGDSESDLLYERSSGVIGASLSSAQEPVRSGESQWRSALRSNNVMFEYHTPTNLSVVAGWLGATAPVWSGDYDIIRICLSFSDNLLYFMTDDGRFYRSETESFGDRTGITGTFAYGLRYAFEEDSRSPAPYMLLTDRYSYPTVISANPINVAGTLTEVLSALGIPRDHAASYTDAESAQVYVTSGFTVSVSGDTIVYRRTDAVSSSVKTVTAGDNIETARRAVQPCADAAGAGRLYCSGYVSDGETATVTFEYYVGGARVFMQYGSAAKVELRGGIVTQMTLRFRAFAYIGEAVTLLPPEQALSARKRGIRLGYYDGAVMQPFWWATDL